MNAEQIRERLSLTRAMMAHPAWTLLEQDWKEEIDMLKQSLVYQVPPSEEVRGVWRGKLDVLERMINLGKILDAVEQGLDGADETDE